MYQDNQPFSRLIAGARAGGGCDDVLSYLQEQQNLTIAQGIDFLTNQDSPAWPYWTFKHLGRELSLDSRHALLARLTLAPSLALRIYLDVADLSDQEDFLLYAAIEQNLPTAVQEIVDGVVTRAKLPGGQ